MKLQDHAKQIRNPFGVMDVPDPNDAEVTQFARRATLDESADDDNAQAWNSADSSGQHGAVEGNWSSRWNGGADPTIPGDAADNGSRVGPNCEPRESASICCSTGIPARARD